MKRYPELEKVCREVGCSVDMPCFGTFDLCRDALEKADSKVVIAAIRDALKETLEGEAENES